MIALGSTGVVLEPTAMYPRRRMMRATESFALSQNGYGTHTHTHTPGLHEGDLVAKCTAEHDATARGRRKLQDTHAQRRGILPPPKSSRGRAPASLGKKRVRFRRQWVGPGPWAMGLAPLAHGAHCGMGALGFASGLADLGHGWCLRNMDLRPGLRLSWAVDLAQ